MEDPKQQALYINCRKSFDSSLVRIIPKKIPNNTISMGYASLDYFDDIEDYAGIHLTTKISNLEKYFALKQQFLSSAKFVSNSEDSCILVINTYGRIQEDTLKIRSCKQVLPVPQYAICEANDSTYIWERNLNEEIIIIDFNFCDILKRENSDIRTDLPIEFAKGYSTGITANDKELTIQYWLIVW